MESKTHFHAALTAIQNFKMADLARLLENHRLQSEVDANGRSLLHHAALVNNKAAIHALVDLDYDIEARDIADLCPRDYAHIGGFTIITSDRGG